MKEGSGFAKMEDVKEGRDIPKKEDVKEGFGEPPPSFTFKDLIISEQIFLSSTVCAGVPLDPKTQRVVDGDISQTGYQSTVLGDTVQYGCPYRTPGDCV